MPEKSESPQEPPLLARDDTIHNAVEAMGVIIRNRRLGSNEARRDAVRLQTLIGILKQRSEKRVTRRKAKRSLFDLFPN